MEMATQSQSLLTEDEIIKDENFTYDGYQVVRGEFFAHLNEPSITVNRCRVSVNTACIKKLPDIDYVQILVNPEEMKLAVRPCQEDEKDSVKWCSINKNNGLKKPKQITCKIFFAKVIELMNWNPEYRYKMLGKLIESQNEILFVFHLKDAEVYQRLMQEGKPRSSRTPVFSAEWHNQFGVPVLEHRKSLQVNIFEGYAVFGLKDTKTIDSDNLNMKEGAEQKNDSTGNMHRPEETQD